MIILAVDEVGRGPLAGPVIAACCGLEHATVGGLADSKKLSAAKRETLASMIRSRGDVGIGEVSASMIDDINILEASRYAMRCAIYDYLERRRLSVHDVAEIWIDGNQLIHAPDMNEYAMIKGDDAIPAMMAASIIAKVERDKRMQQYAHQFPKYGFEKHKGYGTAQHLEALSKYGPCSIHRRRFRPIKDLISS